MLKVKFSSKIVILLVAYKKHLMMTRTNSQGNKVWAKKVLQKKMKNPKEKHRNCKKYFMLMEQISK